MNATLPMLRASSLRDCPRKAVYEATGAPARDRSLKEERQLFRGKSVGRDWLISYAHESKQSIRVESGPDYWVPPKLRCETDDADILAELPIKWSLGVGHADAFETSTGKVIEVLSSAHAGQDMIHSKLLQVVLYMEHLDAARSGALVIVDPASLDDDVLPIATTSKTYAGLVEEVRERIAQVQAWAGEGRLPARVCAKPSDSIGRFCRFAAHCFEGWEPPALALLDDADADQLASRWYALKEQERGAGKVAKDFEKERKQVEAELDGRVPAGTHQVGGWAVTRTDVQMSPKVDLRKAELAGFPVESLVEFLKPGSSFSRWNVAPVEGEPALDFGEVPF